MHVRKFDMLRYFIPGPGSTAAAIAIMVVMTAPQAAYAQSASPGASATPGKPASVLDRIRKKMRETKPPQDKAQKWFDTLDLDKNQEITKQELFQSIRQRMLVRIALGHHLLCTCGNIGHDRHGQPVGARLFQCFENCNIH